MTSIKERLKAGKVPLAGFFNLIPSPVASQAIAAAGADLLVIDQEHGPIGPEMLHAMARVGRLDLRCAQSLERRAPQCPSR